MNRIAFLSFTTALLAVSPFAAPADAAEPERKGWIVHAEAHPNPSAAYRWIDVMLEASARSVDRVGARPTILAREMAIVVTSMYDAFAAYDDHAVGTRLGASLRRPAAERTRANQEIAIAYAAYRALLDVYPEDETWISAQMKAMGFDPSLTTDDVTTPVGVGNVAAKAVIDYRRNDGANQHGDEVGSRTGKPYSDYTHYESKNPDPDVIVDPDRWQPIVFSDGKGGTFTPGFLTPHWYRVKPFALERSDQFRPAGPPLVGSPQLKEEVDECIAFNGSLALDQKAVVEFMRDGPRSTGQSGHWLRFAQDLSRRDQYDLAQDMRLFFCIANTASDAFIACWEAKRFYDSSRPWTLIRHYYKGQKIQGYLGPCKGFGTIPAEQWHPYSPETFITPPFPGYPSGHSTVSAACAKMLELFSGSDRFECIERRKAGMLTEETCDSGRMQAIDGVLAKLEPGQEMCELGIETFTACAEMAGISRVMGGYHIQADNVDALELGRKIAHYSWPIYRSYLDGPAATE